MSRDELDHAIVFTIAFDCPQSRLWEAITSSRELSAWMGGPARIDARVGGEIGLDLPDLRATGRVRVLDPPQPDYRVALLEHTFVEAGESGATSICRWAVRATPQGCELHFTHDGLGEADHARVAAVWDRSLAQSQERAKLERRATPWPEAVARIRNARSALLVSFIGMEVPSVLAATGIDVFAKVGPGPREWAHCVRRGPDVEFEARTTPPERVDLVHVDVSEGFEDYVALAKKLGAVTLWYHSARTRPPEPHDDRGCWVPAAQSAAQRAAAEASGLSYIDDHYIADAARAIR